jgi:NitT/TauT family transport system substrate-binding protein
MSSKKYAVVMASVLAIGMPTPGARAEVSEVSLVQQFGYGYLPLTIMKHEKLIEKQAVKAGLNDLQVRWSVLGNAVPINDGLLAGTIHFGSGGIAPMINAWDKTGKTVQIRGIGALCALPIYLVSRHPYKSVKEFTDNDRISMAGAGQSIQTLYIQMAVAKEYGIANYKKLNHLFVNLSHPDGLTALLSGKEVTAYFSAPPFQNRALAAGMHKVLSSYEISGGPASFLGVWATGKFREENPRTFKAVIEAFKEATAMLNANKRLAAEIYVKDTGGKDNVDDIEQQLKDPEFIFDLAPSKIMPLAEFMYAAGIIKTQPASWKDMFFSEIHEMKGD